MIKYLLDKRLKVEIVDKCNSSQDRLRFLMDRNSDIGAVLALSQTAGRGQRNRSFYSPKNGFYFSIRLRADDFLIKNKPYISLFCGNVVRRAIKDLFSIDCKIKYVNDLYYKDKKVSGILVESRSISKDISDFLIGIGINLYDNENIPRDIKDIYGSLGLNLDFSKISTDLIEYIGSEILSFSRNFSKKSLIDDVNNNLYKKYKSISVKKGSKTYKGILLALDYDLNIVMKLELGYIKINGQGARIII